MLQGFYEEKKVPTWLAHKASKGDADAGLRQKDRRKRGDFKRNDYII